MIQYLAEQIPIFKIVLPRGEEAEVLRVGFKPFVLTKELGIIPVGHELQNWFLKHQAQATGTLA